VLVGLSDLRCIAATCSCMMSWRHQNEHQHRSLQSSGASRWTHQPRSRLFSTLVLHVFSHSEGDDSAKRSSYAPTAWNNFRSHSLAT
jgi:hypothetical protein